jgi:hypothetical protein
MNTHTALFLILLAASAVAGPRTSTNYTIAPDTADSGGRRATSASYTNDGSIGAVVGISTVASPAETAKAGYIAQLTEAIGLLVTPAMSSVNENGTLPLQAFQLLDDSTSVSLNPTQVNWSVVTGPIVGVSAAGVATAGSVYQPTPASVQGALAPYTGSANFTVLDTIPDNFADYAGDGLWDDWQVQYFGPPPNANAGPFVDPDGDGQNNLFEYTAGLIPTDANSVFRLRIERVPGQPGQKNLIFTPRFADRTYVVKAKPSLLTGPFAPLGSSTFSDNARERTVTDLNASGAVKFYQVEITKP